MLKNQRLSYFPEGPEYSLASLPNLGDRTLDWELPLHFFSLIGLTAYSRQGGSELLFKNYYVI